MKKLYVVFLEKLIPHGLAKEYAFYLNLLARFLDSVMLLIAGWITSFIKFSAFMPEDDIYISVICLQIIICNAVFSAYGVYHSWRGKKLTEQLFVLLNAWSVAFLILIMIGFLTKTSETFSREWLVFWAIGSAFLLMIVKTFIYQKIKAIRIRGNNEKRVIYIGNKDAMEKMQLRLKQSPWFGYRGVAWVSVDAPESIAKMTDLDYAGNLSVFNPQTPEDIIFKDILAIYQADELWIVDHLDMCTKISDLLQNETIDIRFILDLDFADLSKYPVTDFMGVLAWNVSISPFQEDKRLIKWLEDKILAALILVLISPLLLVIAIGIKLTSPGAVLFKQKRHGWDGKIITVYKFRSMKTHQEKDGGVTQAQKNDPRITAFGAFLRRTSLDELPQFYNVLQGSMSIVGPRPHALAHNDHYSELIDEYMRRHKVKPGITGWAQINGWRGETDTLEKMQGRVDADLYYIRNWSFWLDIKIILLTVLRAFTDKNAY